MEEKQKKSHKIKQSNKTKRKSTPNLYGFSFEKVIKHLLETKPIRKKK